MPNAEKTLTEQEKSQLRAGTPSLQVILVKEEDFEEALRTLKEKDIKVWKLGWTGLP